MVTDRAELLAILTSREFDVIFYGPKDTPYEGGVWRVHVELPESYPYMSPSICFGNKIFHPNIDEQTGSVCLDVINQTWSPMFDMFNIFEVFLPQLLRYPNAADPLNTEASTLLVKDMREFESRVKQYVRSYAKAASLDTPIPSDEKDGSGFSSLGSDYEDEVISESE